MVGRNKGAIIARDIGKSFVPDEGAPVVAIEHFDLEIKPGEFVSLIGPSGCGKSTFLRILTGLETSSSGTVTVDGELVNGTSHKRGLVFQNPKLFPWYNIHDNVAYGLKARKIFKDNRQLVNDYLDMVGLTGFEKSYPNQLSGGMAQRASLARALINMPDVLSLDEPLGALDAFTRVSMQDEILNIWRNQEITMVMVTHDVEEAIYLSDRVVVMRARPGRITAVVDIKLPRPRKRDSEDFIKLRQHLLSLLEQAKERTA